MRRLLGMVFIAGLVFGGVEIWNWVRYRTPVEVVFASNDVSELPKHVRLKNVFLSPGDIASKGGLGGKQLFIPIRALEDPSSARTLHFVLKTTDPAVVAALEQANASQEMGEIIAALKPLLTKREVSGLVDSGGLSRKQRQQLREQFPILTEDFQVLEEGRHPSLFAAGFLFALGGLALVVLNKIDPSPVVEPIEAPPPATSPTGSPPAVPPPIRAVEPPPLAPVPVAAPNLAPARDPAPAPASFDDPVTAGISQIKPGDKDVPPDWIRAFLKADVFVLSAENMKPQSAFVFGPGDYVGVFTRIELAQQCLREMPHLKYAMRVKGREILSLVRTQGRGVWLNPRQATGSVKFPAGDIEGLLTGAA